MSSPRQRPVSSMGTPAKKSVSSPIRPTRPSQVPMPEKRPTGILKPQRSYTSNIPDSPRHSKISTGSSASQSMPYISNKRPDHRHLRAGANKQERINSHDREGANEASDVASHSQDLLWSCPTGITLERGVKFKVVKGIDKHITKVIEQTTWSIASQSILGLSPHSSMHDDGEYLTPWPELEENHLNSIMRRTWRDIRNQYADNFSSKYHRRFNLNRIPSLPQPVWAQYVREHSF